ncbi:MAG: LemA family protein [Firmicutes bacterium]|nr:LemA family protein [Bacillota bacterium]
MPTWLIVVLVIVVLLVLWVISTYNSLVSLRNKVKDQWAQIDTVLKRRFDLIPNLVETVKGYAKHESETLEAVIAARNTYVSASAPEDQMKADGELTKAISKLFALSEAYPELKANENFNSLQKELSETEDKIQYARQFYNDIVRKYNTKRETFPTVLIAGMLGFKEVNFFEASAEERQNVQVKF